MPQSESLKHHCSIGNDQNTKVSKERFIFFEIMRKRSQSLQDLSLVITTVDRSTTIHLIGQLFKKGLLINKQTFEYLI